MTEDGRYAVVVKYFGYERNPSRLVGYKAASLTPFRNTAQWKYLKENISQRNTNNACSIKQTKVSCFSMLGIFNPVKKMFKLIQTRVTGIEPWPALHPSHRSSSARCMYIQYTQLNEKINKT